MIESLAAVDEGSPKPIATVARCAAGTVTHPNLIEAGAASRLDLAPHNHKVQFGD